MLYFRNISCIVFCTPESKSHMEHFWYIVVGSNINGYAISVVKYKKIVLYLFRDSVSLCSIDWSGTACVGQASFELRDSHLFLPPKS